MRLRKKQKDGQWRVHDEPDEWGMVHVWPDDGTRHVLDGTDPCPCGVELETIGAYCLVLHQPGTLPS